MLFPALSRNECLIPRAQTSLVMTKPGAIVSRVIALKDTAYNNMMKNELQDVLRTGDQKNIMCCAFVCAFASMW